MACPIHIWVPLVAAAAPVVRIAKHRVQGWRAVRASRQQPDATPRELKRWAPVASTTAAAEHHVDRPSS